jgi:hypothetical protein
MAFDLYDLRDCRLLDLSQNFSVDSPPFAYYDGPTIKWVKKIAFPFRFKGGDGGEGMYGRRTLSLLLQSGVYRILRTSCESRVLSL